MNNNVKFDPPITMPDPEALVAAVELAISLTRRPPGVVQHTEPGVTALEAIFGGFDAYEQIRDRALAFLLAVQRWAAEVGAKQPDIDAVREASAQATQAHADLRRAEPAFFDLAYRRMIDESLGDASGHAARQVLGRVVQVRDVAPEHIEALWRIVTRTAHWEDVLAAEGPRFRDWLRAGIVRLGAKLAAETDCPSQIVAWAPVPAENLADLDAVLVRAMETSDLGDVEAQVLGMSNLAGMDGDSIAVALERKRGAVDSALSRAGNKIKKIAGPM